MTNQLTKAYVNLNGIVQCITHLCTLDSKSGEMIKNKNVTIQFSVKNGPVARLIFKNGTCSYAKGRGPSHIKLGFSSPEHLNNMMEEKANPRILKGFTKIGFLKKDFTGLLKRLEYYLKPQGNQLKDNEYRRINTILTFQLVFASLPEVGMYDPIGAKVMQKAKTGQFCVSIDNSDLLVRIGLSKGNIEKIESSNGTPEFRFAFSSLDKANDILGGEMDFLSAIGLGYIKMEGFIPVMQTVEHVLPLVEGYLK